jgi:hypothetical protein
MKEAPLLISSLALAAMREPGYSARARAIRPQAQHDAKTKARRAANRRAAKARRRNRV